MTPEQRAKHIKTIAKIEEMPRPAKWREIKKFFLELHPEFKVHDDQFAEACKELRQKNENKTGSSKQGDLRNSMKIPQYIYNSLIKMDPDLQTEWSGRNRGAQWEIGKQLYKEFKEYRIARIL